MVNVDTDQRNADWVKTLAWEYPTDAEYFLAIIGGPDQLDHFMTLPVAEQMPQSLAVELGVRTGKSVMLKHLPGQHDQDTHGREGSADDAPWSAPGASDHIKFTLKTLHSDDAPRVEATIRRLSEKYPRAAKQIKTVAAVPLKTRWGSYDSVQRKMKFTNYGGKHEDWRDPNLEDSVAHEFGHAMVSYLAGGIDAVKPLTVRQAIDRGISPSSAVQAIQWYNDQVRAFRDERDAVVNGAYRRVKEALGGQNIHRVLLEEFADNPSYYASSKEELLAQAFSHWENGKHGPIADAVGPYFEELYREKSA